MRIHSIDDGQKNGHAYDPSKAGQNPYGKPHQHPGEEHHEMGGIQDNTQGFEGCFQDKDPVNYLIVTSYFSFNQLISHFLLSGETVRTALKAILASLPANCW